MEVMREIESACGLAFTDIVNNSNLCGETTAKTVLDSLAYVEKLQQLSGLPLWMHTAEESVAKELEDMIPEVFSMQLQKKYFDLPTNEPKNRPLWG